MPRVRNTFKFIPLLKIMQNWGQWELKMKYFNYLWIHLEIGRVVNGKIKYLYFEFHVKITKKVYFFKIKNNCPF